MRFLVQCDSVFVLFRAITGKDDFTYPSSMHVGNFSDNYYNAQDGGFYYGRYFTDLKEAEANFELRVKEYLGLLENLPSSLESEEAIKIPERILEGIEAVREGNTTNMFNAHFVQLQAVALGYLETAQWIEANSETYYSGVFRGFVAL